MNQPAPSSQLSSEINEPVLKTATLSKKTSWIENPKVLQTAQPSVKIKNIPVTQIIEGESTTSMNKKLDQEPLEQPPISKATNSKLQQ
jgi:hypothetical protein